MGEITNIEGKIIHWGEGVETLTLNEFKKIHGILFSTVEKAEEIYKTIAVKMPIKKETKEGDE